MPTSNIVAKIGLNSAGFKTGLAQCRAVASRFKTSIGGIFSNAGSQILSMLGVSAGIAGLGTLAKSAIDTASQISDMATHLRMGTDELQVLQSLARDAGTDFSKLEMALNNLNLRTVEACDGNTNYREAFERLGIDLKNFTTLSTEKKLERLAKSYKDSEESVTALNDVSTLLGQKAGSQLLEVLDRLATDGMEKLSESAKQAGNVMDVETVAALDRAGDEIGRWQNRIIVWVGNFLSDMGSSIGRVQWAYILGQKLAQIGQFIEIAFRDMSNYILSVFTSIGRYINGKFGSFITPIRNVLTDFISYLGNALASLVGYFDADWERAINNSIKALDKLRNESNKIAEEDKGKSFGEIFSDEMANAKFQNNTRKRSNLWTSKSVDWYDKEIEKAEKLRNIEKEQSIEAEKARKSKYAKADKNVEVKDIKKDKSSKSKAHNYNDSSLAKIGGGGLTATRYNVGEKQLSEAKKQSQLLTKIAENTEKQSNKSELLMK